MRWRMAFALVALVASASGLVAQQEPATYPGTVIDKVSGIGLPGTSVTAFKDASKRSVNGRCPEYGTREGATTTAVAGQFLLPIAPSLTTFAAVYCRSGYFPRIEPVNPVSILAAQNNPTRRMSADPIGLISLTATPEQIAASLRRDLDHIRATLQYARTAAGPEGQKVPFEDALTSLDKASPTDASIIRLLANQARTTGQ